MSHRLPLNYGTLDKFLLEIREFIKNSDIQANPFFHLVKPTEENISKYRFYKPESLLFLTFDTILNISIGTYLHFVYLNHESETKCKC